MCQSNSCQWLHNNVGTTCTTSPEQIKVMELEDYSQQTYNKLVHSAMTCSTVVGVIHKLTVNDFVHNILGWWRDVSKHNSLLLLVHQSLLFANTCLFTGHTCYVQFHSTCSTSVIITFSLLNTLIHIILIISHNLLISSTTLYALSLCISPRLLRCYVLLLVIPTSLFALSSLLIDRARRKTLHTLHLYIDDLL